MQLSIVLIDMQQLSNLIRKSSCPESVDILTCKVLREMRDYPFMFFSSVSTQFHRFILLPQVLMKKLMLPSCPRRTKTALSCARQSLELF